MDVRFRNNKFLHWLAYYNMAIYYLLRRAYVI